MTAFRKDSWRYREVDAEGDPVVTVYSFLSVRPIPPEEAAEFAAEELYRRQEEPTWPDDYLEQIDGMERTVEVECDPGFWRRFVVTVHVEVKYRATEVNL